jgi:hypothetical protein
MGSFGINLVWICRVQAQIRAPRGANRNSARQSASPLKRARRSGGTGASTVWARGQQKARPLGLDNHDTAILEQ